MGTTSALLLEPTACAAKNRTLYAYGPHDTPPLSLDSTGASTSGCDGRWLGLRETYVGAPIWGLACVLAPV
eukprot:4598986-Prymnesium_polylepis.1